ncbi:thiamine pyrophosphate-dependent enzyme [Psychroserpens sp.]|uniref:alpha-ketoacid dehydrogenase subunit alpha/beta n=1 Tax=Psychroserpens sp. TaxID=2020870 RepID=UPI001B168771|nr:thiamine pyrophosphate-dependent enzyme [Psychroserpens sp.]MBO6607981.1 tungsten formylmethanofuran dehydrogenase [Psychroserpens sp.]MBO6654892.1 tungsten formylmethanofuran dehydrogenase [Psychroserpens sp.]MBO6683034.1 tungsten formylmethanofuran dehydrogenase [Psychroserpens sp.]MBO6751339.1 tungsten formylmethanofuran dehydrogenase [Psychroserpens sp.]MBO6916522.1 tungsten formylmethanofuran dehydrogenase [Psychroserpens sp.]
MNKTILKKGFSNLCTAKAMAELYEANFKQVSKYVHATSRGHEAIQTALGMQLLPQDYAFPYYRDDAMLLSFGLEPYDLMLQLLAKKEDPFSGGRTYYSHPSLKDEDKPKIPHQSSATGMQAIPATGVAMGMQYKELQGLDDKSIQEAPLVVCSLGDASVTEGEIAEAFQMAALKQMPILYLVQDNGWDISANAAETRAQNAYEYAQGFHGLDAISIDGANFIESYTAVADVISTIRKERRPFLVHAKVPLLNHHTSGVRMEWYRDDLDEAKSRDPYPVLKQQLTDNGFTAQEVNAIENDAIAKVKSDFAKALEAEDPKPEDLFTHDFAPTPVTEEQGTREPEGADKVVMVDCALFAVEELMRKHKECLLYGQDVGGRLGGVFREAATLAQKFGDDRVFNTPIQEAFIVGSTVGMSAVGLKPIVEVQFADYIWPGLNQLFTEVSRSCYLSNGKWPVSMILRVPIGAYGSGGPYHSSSVESVITNIRGIKIAYPSNGADLKGLMKAAYYDPNPVVILEHKGLYWSKVPGTLTATSVEPSEDYILPFGQAWVLQEIWKQEDVETMTIVTYGMGVHWAYNASGDLRMRDQIEIIDLRTLYPLDEKTVMSSVKKTGKCLIVTEEPSNNSFARALAGKIQEECFKHLDAPVMTIGSENMPAIPLNSTLEQTMIPSTEKVKAKIEELLYY